jgi:hypothetical protein
MQRSTSKVPSPHGRKGPHPIRHRSRRCLSRLRALGSSREAPHAFGVAGERPACGGALPEWFLSQGEKAARGPVAAPSRDVGGLLPPGDHLNRQPACDQGIPRWRLRPVDISLGSRTQAAEGSRHCGIHRPRSQPDDPAYESFVAFPVRFRNKSDDLTKSY